MIPREHLSNELSRIAALVCRSVYPLVIKDDVDPIEVLLDQLLVDIRAALPEEPPT